MGERVNEVSKDKASLGEPSHCGGGDGKEAEAPQWD